MMLLLYLFLHLRMMFHDPLVLLLCCLREVPNIQVVHQNLHTSVETAGAQSSVASSHGLMCIVGSRFVSWCLKICILIVFVRLVGVIVYLCFCCLSNHRQPNTCGKQDVSPYDNLAGFDPNRPLPGIAINYASPEKMSQLQAYNRSFAEDSDLFPPVRIDLMRHGTLAGTHLNMLLRCYEANMVSSVTGRRFDVGLACNTKPSWNYRSSLTLSTHVPPPPPSPTLSLAVVYGFNSCSRGPAQFPRAVVCYV
jgi:hypothetical protein